MGIVDPNKALKGLTFQDLPEGWVPKAATILVKCLDEDGDEVWCFRSSEQYLSDEELIGALTLRTKSLTRQILGKFVEAEEDEEF